MGKEKNNARLFDPTILIQAGINPKTGLLRKLNNSGISVNKDEIKKFLRIVDEQDAVNRYTWYNLPCGITSLELERMLYYRGQLAFFYFKELNQFYFMPYALNGTIDFYGRYNTIHPVPFANGTTDDDKKRYAKQQAILSKKNFNVVYGVMIDKLTEEILDTSCVLLHDYTKQLSQTILSRQSVNDALLDMEAQCIPLMATSLVAGSGVKGLRVNSKDESDSTLLASQAVFNAALTQQPFVPIVGNLEFQPLTDGVTLKAQEYMLAMQSLDNLRLSGYGLENGGLFEKKQHMLESENAVNQANVGLVMQDGLSIRQNFCNIVNSIWGLGIWCEVNESVVGTDLDGDGVAYERDEGENSGIEGGTNNE